MKINLGKEFQKLPALLAQYEEEYAQYIEDQDLSGKTLERICKENHSLYGYYEERAIELKHILEYMEMRVAETTGKLYQSYKKGSNVSLGEREIHQYIRSDPLFVEVNIKMLEVKEMHEKFASAVTAFKNIGYAMNNLTRLKVAGLEDQTL